MASRTNSCKTLIVGGGGFIGSRLVVVMAQDPDREIWVLGRSETPRLPLPSQVRYIQGDAGDRQLLSSLLSECEEVIDLAYGTVPKSSYDEPVQDVLLNLPPSVNLIQEAAQHHLRRFILVSSGGTVYGPAIRLPIDELHPTDPISPYGITKLALEKYALMFHRLGGLPAVIVRPANPYGPSQQGGRGQGLIGTAIHAILENAPINVFGQGTIRDYLYIDDVAEAIVAALNHGQPGEIYNVGSGVGIDNLAVIKRLTALADAAGYAVSIRDLPARGFDVPANVLDSTKLRKICGWVPRFDFDSALEWTWQEICRHTGKMS